MGYEPWLKAFVEHKPNIKAIRKEYFLSIINFHKFLYIDEDTPT